MRLLFLFLVLLTACDSTTEDDGPVPSDSWPGMYQGEATAVTYHSDGDSNRTTGELSLRISITESETLDSLSIDYNAEDRSASSTMSNGTVLLTPDTLVTVPDTFDIDPFTGIDKVQLGMEGDLISGKWFSELTEKENDVFPDSTHISFTVSPNY